MAMETKHKVAIVAVAAAIAASYEGTRYVPYQDPRPNDPIWTVCQGHTGKDIIKGKRYTADECKRLLESDMLVAVNAVERCHPGLPDNVLIAFADAVYNIGPKVACNSTAAVYLRRGDYDKACRELPKWSKSNGVELPGLVKRRKAEMELCLER